MRMRNIGNVFGKAVLAGVCIALGGTVYLSVENKIIGSLLFTIGLYAIVLNGLFLLTTWIGNLVGTGIGALAVLQTRISGIAENVDAICANKLVDSPVSIFILAVFCGMLMYIAVDGFKEKGNPLILFMGVSVFILSGFEHCIANMFYFSLAGVWSVKAFLYLLIMTAGNSIGGILIPLIKK